MNEELITRLERHYNDLVDGGTNASELRADLMLAIAALRDEDEDDTLRERMASLLTRTANALKGEPRELYTHSWHDLPEIAALRGATPVVERCEACGGRKWACECCTSPGGATPARSGKCVWGKHDECDGTQSLTNTRSSEPCGCSCHAALRGTALAEAHWKDRANAAEQEVLQLREQIAKLEVAARGRIIPRNWHGPAEDF